MLLFLAKKKPSLFLEFSEAVFLLLPSESGNVSFYLENPGGTPGAFLIELDAQRTAWLMPSSLLTGGSVATQSLIQRGQHQTHLWVTRAETTLNHGAILPLLMATGSNQNLERGRRHLRAVFPRCSAAVQRAASLGYVPPTCFIRPRLSASTPRAPVKPFTLCWRHRMGHPFRSGSVSPGTKNIGANSTAVIWVLQIFLRAVRGDQQFLLGL